MGASYCNPYLSVDSAYQYRPSDQTPPMAVALRSVAASKWFLNNLHLRCLLLEKSVLILLETKRAQYYINIP